MNQFFGTLALKPVEQILNQLIAKDPHVMHQIARFSGKVLEIKCTSPLSATLTIRFQQSTIRLGAVPTTTLHIDADAAIQGTANTLLGALTATHDTPLANPNLTISGDAIFVQDLLAALRTLDVDWRDVLGPFVGDFGINEIDDAGNRLRDWTNLAQSRLYRSVKDYVHDEVDLVPRRDEIERFHDQLDQLRLATDRLQAKAVSFREKLDKSLKNQQLSS